jgi:hypothetical protein
MEIGGVFITGYGADLCFWIVCEDVCQTMGESK